MYGIPYRYGTVLQRPGLPSINVLQRAPAAAPRAAPRHQCVSVRPAAMLCSAFQVGLLPVHVYMRHSCAAEYRGRGAPKKVAITSDLIPPT